MQASDRMTVRLLCRLGGGRRVGATKRYEGAGGGGGKFYPHRKGVGGGGGKGFSHAEEGGGGGHRRFRGTY